MNDGTTALPVSPVSKEEAMTISSMFAKVADALVQASSMPDQIRTLQADLDRLRSDYEAKTVHAQELDMALADMRTQRDRAENSLAESNRQLGDLQRANFSLEGRVHDLNNSLDRVREELAQTRKDRDDAILAHLQADEDLTKAKATLADIQARVSALFPAPKPEPEPVPVPETVPEPDQSTGSFPGLPPSASTPTPKWDDPAPAVHPSHDDPSNWSPTRY